MIFEDTVLTIGKPVKKLLQFIDVLYVGLHLKELVV